MARPSLASAIARAARSVFPATPRVWAAGLALGCAACGSEVTPSQPEPPPPNEGVVGTVLKYVGDFSCCAPTGTKEPLSVNVNAASGPIELLWPEGEGLVLVEEVPVVASAPTDEDGRYTLLLHPGEYTIFAEYEGAILLGGSLVPQGDTYLSRPTEVLEDELAEVHLLETSDAYF
jgi:hypothetical protein